MDQNAYKKRMNHYDDVLTARRWWSWIYMHWLWKVDDNVIAREVLSMLPDDFQRTIMNVYEFGTENRRNLLSFQGYCTCWRDYISSIELLAQQFHVIAPAFEGHDPEEKTDFISVEKTVGDTTDYLLEHGHASLDAVYGLSTGGSLILVRGKGYCFYNQWNVNSRLNVLSLQKLKNIGDVELIFTSHSGYTNCMDAALSHIHKIPNWKEKGFAVSENAPYDPYN